MRDRFVTNYLKVCELCILQKIRIFSVRCTNLVLMKAVVLVQICMDHILTVLKTPAERASGFVALGKMTGALDGELVHYLLTIMSYLRDVIYYLCHLCAGISYLLTFVLSSPRE